MSHKNKQRLLARDITFDREPYDGSGAALDAAYDSGVWGSEGGRLRTGRGAHCTHHARMPYVEAAGEEVIHFFRHTVARAEKVGAVEGLALLLSFRCATNHLVRLFSTRQVVLL